MTPDDVAALARRIAGEEIGGQPPRCTGHKADRYNAAYNAVVKACDAISTARGTAFVVENTDGNFVASFSTKFLADFFVEEGGGCYRHRVHGSDGHG